MSGLDNLQVQQETLWGKLYSTGTEDTPSYHHSTSLCASSSAMEKNLKLPSCDRTACVFSTCLTSHTEEVQEWQGTRCAYRGMGNDEKLAGAHH